MAKIKQDFDCPFCGFEDVYRNDETGTYHCNKCDRAFTEDDKEHETLRHQISAICSGGFHDEQNPLQCGMYLSSLDGKACDNPLRTESIFLSEDGTMWATLVDYDEPVDFESICTADLRKMLAILTAPGEETAKKETPEEGAKFTCEINMKDINSSMILDSGQTVATLEKTTPKGTFLAEIRICGDVKVDYKGDCYKCASQMPDKLLKMLNNWKSIYEKKVHVHMNNWPEIFLYETKDGEQIWTGQSDVVDAEGSTEDELRKLLEEYIDDYVG